MILLLLLHSEEGGWLGGVSVNVDVWREGGKGRESEGEDSFRDLQKLEDLEPPWASLLLRKS